MRLRAAAARHLERGAEAVRRDEAELPCGLRVAAARDQDRAEPVRRGVAGAPFEERLQRVARAAGAVVRDRALVLDRAVLGVAHRADVAARCARRRRARGTASAWGGGSGAANGWTRIAVPPCGDRRRVSPEPQREPEPEVGGVDGVRTFARAATAWSAGSRSRARRAARRARRP